MPPKRQRAPADDHAQSGPHTTSKRARLANDKRSTGCIALHDVVDELWSKKALDVAQQITDKIDVDAYYEYPDFRITELYNVLDLQVERWNELFRTNSKLTEAWRVLEGITLFIARLEDDKLENTEDGERFRAFVRVFSSAWHSLATRLHTHSPSKLLGITNASNVLRTAAALVDAWCATVDDDMEDIPLRVRVMLCRDGLPYACKPHAIRSKNDMSSGSGAPTPPRKTSMRRRNAPSTQTSISTPSARPTSRSQAQENEDVQRLAESSFDDAEQDISARRTESYSYEWTLNWTRYRHEYDDGATLAGSGHSKHKERSKRRTS